MESLARGTVVGRYRIDGPLGRGGMAIVYEATDESVGRRVALKMLGPELGSDPKFATRFRREAKMQAALEHPHVVTIYESGESPHGLYIAMSLVRGPTLAALLGDGVLGAGRALRLLRQVAAALDAAHAAGLVHRDVKPRNVLVGADDHAYLADFGLTKLGADTDATLAGQVVGTLAYLAPEIIRGDPATPASDVYAFAAMAFECLSGGPVFPRPTQASQLYAHTSEPPPRISRRRADLPSALDPVFKRALAKEPAQRPASASAFMDAVSDALRGCDLGQLGPPASPAAIALSDTTVEPVPAPVRRSLAERASARTGVIVVAALVGVCAGAAAGAGAVALIDDGGSPAASDETATLAALSGARVLGSDLSEPGRLRDCKGGPVRPSSAGCTIAQATLPSATVVVPDDGVIRRWAVRSARGELALNVLRPRGEGFFRTAASRNEFVGNDGVHAFATNLAVERGDVLAVRVLQGSGVGARSVPGASTNRWIPALTARRPADLAAGSGFDQAILMRADLFAGRPQTLPEQVTGRAAATVDAGRVARRKELRFGNGRAVTIALVSLSDRFALDLYTGGRRRARLFVPDLRPRSGRLITFDVSPEESEPEQVNVFLEYANADSSRILTHEVAAYAREFEFIS